MELIISVIIWTLALYGLFEIIKNIIYIYTYTKLNSKGMYLLLAIKNQEENIEFFLRNLLFRVLYGKEDTIKNIIVADLDSDDSTMEILKKLEKDYDCLSVKNWKECKQMLDYIDE